MGSHRRDHHRLHALIVSFRFLNPQLSTFMFRRIIYEDWQLIFPVIALAVASLIYAAAAWRASRMKPIEVERLARLPFEN
jgi:hypothetical protein